jgi:hypothetical protein
MKRLRLAALLLIFLANRPAQSGCDFLLGLAKKLMGRSSNPELISKTKVKYKGEEVEVPPHILPALKSYLARGDVDDETKSIMLKNLQGYFGGKLHDTYRADQFGDDFHRIVNGAKSLPDDTEEMVILTHQTAHWQGPSVAEIKAAPGLQKLPILSLHSMHFNLRSPELMRQADELRWSHMGRVEALPRNATRFHLYGGFCDSCLAETLESAVETQRGSGVTKPLTFFLHSTRVFSSRAQRLSETLEEAGARIPKLSDILYEDVAGLGPLTGREVMTPHGAAYEYKNEGANPITIYVLR